MSTRCNIHFHGRYGLASNIYRHSDGYPGEVEDGKEVEFGVLSDLLTFFRHLKAEVPDNRFGDPEYLAAKFLVWQAQQLAVTYDFSGPEVKTTPKANRLDFLGVSPCIRDHGDIEYVYEILTHKRDAEGFPVVRWTTAYSFKEGEVSADSTLVYLAGDPDEPPKAAPTPEPTAEPLDLSSPEQTDKHTILVTKVRMPDGPDQEKGTHNELAIEVTYIKDGIGRQPRGYYLHLHGYTVRGLFKSFILMQDPNQYILLEETKRFSGAKLKALVNTAVEPERESIETLLNLARDYYRGKMAA